MAETQEASLVGITGGIGAGKSVVSRILRLKGYRVYDCDSRAKELMTGSEEIIAALRERFGESCVLADGSLDRKLISSRVFSVEEERIWLNRLVHAAVRKDLDIWRKTGKDTLCFVESAIIATSGLDRMCDSIWLVESPEKLRIRRALGRGGITEKDLMQRIRTQQSEFDMLPPDKTKRISNSGDSSLIEQIDILLEVESKKLE
ncbi:MAG: dephospho-CoA kinase [Muribaculaceae bacterium]|nr:dephospho-CoA kinase [Muribaculaceae bacterium]